MKVDIGNRKQIEQLILQFYSQLLKDEEMKVVFDGIDFHHHVPKITDFWAFVLLEEEGYKTNVFDKHLHLPIQLHHFDIWLKNFIEAVDFLYIGEKAELAKQRATVLAYTFKSKWEKIKS